MLFGGYQPNPVALNVGAVSIYWYGLLIFISLVLGLFLGKRLFKLYNLAPDKFYDLSFYLIIFGIIGARLWHVFSEFSYYSSHLIDVFKIWNGGLAIHGAILAGVLVIFAYSLRNQSQKNSRLAFASAKNLFLLLLDIFAPLVVLGQAIGRWGNYFNGELYGAPTNLPWAISINISRRLPDFKAFQFYHPIFLYESLWCLLLFIFLIYLHQSRRTSPGTISFSFLGLYSLERFFIGFLRIDPQASWLNLRLDQWVSLLLIILAAIFFVLIKKSKK